MRKIIFTMLALVGLTASAQGIKSGSEWNISNLVYEAKVNIDNTITSRLWRKVKSWLSV